jgi:hypothetical protein
MGLYFARLFGFADMRFSDRLSQRLAPHLSRERAKTVFQELVRVPSPQTDLLEEEPQLRAFMQAALVPRMRALDMSNVRLDAMGNLRGARSCW